MRYMILLTHPKDFFECLQRDLWKPYKNSVWVIFMEKAQL